VPTDKQPKGADKPEPKKASVIKPVKKLIIVDGNEDAKKEEPALEPAKTSAKKIAIVSHDETNELAASAGDTPEVTDAAELSTIAEKIEKTVAVQNEEKSAEKSEDEQAPELQPVAASADSSVDQGIDSESIPATMTIGDAIDAATEKDTDIDDTAIEEEPLLENEPSEATETTTQNVENNLEQQPDQTTVIETDKDFADQKTSDAVDDIVAAESDELLERQDAEKATFNTPVQKKQSKLVEVCKNWWVNPATKWGTIVGLLLVAVSLALLPVSRYAILNNIGVRAKMSLTVISNDNQQSLKNVTVTIADQTKTTDEEGRVSFDKLKLGKQSITVKKRGYASVQKSKILGWGSNPLGNITMTATGTKFTFVAKDYLSGKPLQSAEAVSGDFNATASSEGRIVLAIDQGEDKEFAVTIKAPDYREEVITIKPTDTMEKTVQMVAAKKHVFVSKRSGKFDVYKIDADAKNEALLVAATGSEREDLSLLTHPTRQFAALVSTREGKRNKDGYLLSGLFIVNVANGEMQKIGQSERIQLIDWTGDRLVYIAIVDGVSAANPARSKLYSFEIGQPGAKELASANYFNDATVFKGAVYYATSSYAVPVSSVKFYKTNPDGSGTSTLFDKEVWNIFRNDYDTLYLSVQQDWYELKQNGVPVKLSGAPTNPKNRVYKDNFEKKLSLWTDQRDGKGVLLAYNVDTKKDDVLETRAGLTQPASWLNNTTYIFRVSDSREVADYVKSTLGGDAKKLRDVTNTDMSYYYN